MAIQRKPRKEKYVTTEKFILFEQRFDRAMASIAESFQSVQDSLQNQISTLATMVQEMRDENREFFRTLHDHDVHLARHEQQLDDMSGRVELLEKKNS